MGARFDDRVTGKLATFAPQAKIIHIDIDPSSISKNVDVDIPVVGDAKAVLAEMLPLIEHRDRDGVVRPDRRVEAAIPVQLPVEDGHDQAAGGDRGDQPR